MLAQQIASKLVNKKKNKRTKKEIVEVLSLSTNEESMLNLLFSEWNICFSVRTSQTRSQGQRKWLSGSLHSR